MVPTGTAGVLLAGAWSPNLIITSLYLVGALLLAAAVIAIVSRWRRRYGTERLTPSEQLTHFRSLYEKGEISAEEFARLRTLLTGQVQPTPVPKKPLTGITPEPNAAPPANGQSPPEEGIRPA
jgi:uncharacterized membrane protein